MEEIKKQSEKVTHYRKSESGQNSELDSLLDETDRLLQEGKQYLRLNGVNYDLSEWVTLKVYAHRFGLENTMVVSNWIARGIIPAESVITVENLNNLKLIRAIPYK